MSMFGDRFKRNTEENEGDPMLPFMSLLLIIIPILITNLSFYHLRSIDVNTPGNSDEEQSSEEPKDVSPDTKVMLQLNIDQKNVYLDLINEGTGELVKSSRTKLNKAAPGFLRKRVLKYRKKYEKLDTMMVTIDERVRYEDMVSILDECKRDDEELEALNNRVPSDELSSEEKKKKEKKFMLVLLPKVKEEVIAEEESDG